MIPASVKECFWRIIEKCLVEFHKLTKESARIALLDLYRDSLSNSSSELERDLIYHEDPFELANDMSGKHLSRSEYAGRYKDLRRQITSLTSLWVEFQPLLSLL